MEKVGLRVATADELSKFWASEYCLSGPKWWKDDDSRC